MDDDRTIPIIGCEHAWGQRLNAYQIASAITGRLVICRGQSVDNYLVTVWFEAGHVRHSTVYASLN